MYVILIFIKSDREERFLVIDAMNILRMLWLVKKI